MSLVRVIDYAIPFLVLVRLTDILSVETYGVLALTVAFNQFAATLIDMGFTLSATERIAKKRDCPQFVGRYAAAVLGVKAIAFVVAAICLLSYALLSEKYAAETGVFFAALLPLLGLSFQPLWFFSGIERMGVIAALSVASRFSYLGFVFLLVRDRDDALLVHLANGVGQIGTAIAGIYMISRTGYRLIPPKWRDIRYAIVTSFGFLVSRISAMILGYSGVPLLGLFGAAGAVGHYSLAEQLYRVMQSVFAPLSQSLLPYMSKERDLRLLARLSAGCMAVAATGALVGHFAGPYLVTKVFGEAWAESLPVLNVFLVAIVVHIATVLLGYPLASALNRVDVANRSVMYGTLLFLAMAAWLLTTDRLSGTMVAWAMVAAESYILLHRAIVLLPLALKASSQARARSTGLEK